MADGIAECTALCRRYAKLIDAAEFEAFADLFSDDAILDLPGRRMCGREEMIAVLSQRKSSVVMFHFCTNILIEPVSDDEAKGTTYVTFYRHDIGDGALPAPIIPPSTLGIYDDVFVRTVNGWRFRQRILRPLFRQI